MLVSCRLHRLRKSEREREILVTPFLPADSSAASDVSLSMLFDDMILSACESSRCRRPRHRLCIMFFRRNIIWLILRRIIIRPSERNACSLRFARKTKGQRERENWPTRDIVVNNIDIEKDRGQERERTIVTHHICTYASKFLSFSLSVSLAMRLYLHRSI